MLFQLVSKTVMVWLWCAVILTISPKSRGATPFINDVTKNVVSLGVPTAQRFSSEDRIYARNVWDMQRFGNRIYLGSGNSSNVGPARAPGPIDIWAWDIVENRFVNEFTVDEDQIDAFRVVDGSLVVPGHDPHDSWALGNFYRREAGGWVKIRTLPNAIHTYDMIGFDGRIYASLGSSTIFNVVVSGDGGLTWDRMNANFLIGDPPLKDVAVRANTLFTLAGRLYVSADVGPVSVLRDGRFVDEQIDFFPGIPRDIITSLANITGLRVVRPVEFAGRLIYIAGRIVNDHQWTPYGLLTATPDLEIRKVALPAGAVPWDIASSNGACFVLTAAPAAEGGFTVAVLASRNLEEWEEILQFRADTFARSFELQDGNFYFGLGSEVDPVSPSTGTILRVFRQRIPFFTQPLLVHAGPDLSATLSEAITLAGSVTDRALLRQAGLVTVWSQASGPAPAILEPGSPGIASVSFQQTGVYVFRLTSRGGGAEASDTVNVTVTAGNQPPVIRLPGYFRVREGEALLLDGSGAVDPEGGAVRFTWDFESDGPIDSHNVTVLYAPATAAGTRLLKGALTACDEQLKCSTSGFDLAVIGRNDLLGDLNRNGRVEIADATLALQIMVNQLVPTDTHRVLGDFDGNGRIDIRDATRILRLSIGLSM